MPINRDNLFLIKKNNIFFETGTYHGEGVQAAVDARFDKIFSIECKKEFYDECTSKFCDDRISLIYGDSSKILYDYIKLINDEITFFLDAHYMWNDLDQKLLEHPGKGRIPLIEELDQIKKHHIKTHTIIIDDIVPLSDLEPKGNNPPTGSKETLLDNLKKSVLSINKNYNFTLLNNSSFLLCQI